MAVTEGLYCPDSPHHMGSIDSYPLLHLLQIPQILIKVFLKGFLVQKWICPLSLFLPLGKRRQVGNVRISNLAKPAQWTIMRALIILITWHKIVPSKTGSDFVGRHSPLPRPIMLLPSNSSKMRFQHWKTSTTMIYSRGLSLLDALTISSPFRSSNQERGTSLRRRSLRYPPWKIAQMVDSWAGWNKPVPNVSLQHIMYIRGG